MAQNTEPFHIRQQHRRNKLRVGATETNQELIFPISQNPLKSSDQNPMKDPNSHYQCYYNCYDPVRACFDIQGNLSLSLSMHDRQNAAVLGFEQMRRCVPLGPFTGYTLVLKQSRFLKPAQQILDGFCGVEDFGASSCLFEGFNENSIVRDLMASGKRVENTGKNSSLVLMLDEVYRRYKLYCRQMQSVAKSFETVCGLANAAPYISLAVKAVISHFTCLKNTILDRLHVTGNIEGLINRNSVKDYSHRINISSDRRGVFERNRVFLQNPVWRSQRGLPDHAVALLRTWLFENFLHPYPTDSEKQFLAQQTGLSRTQVSNWFINARVRLWKPMVEEMHALEEHNAKRHRSESSDRRRQYNDDQATNCAACGIDFAGGGRVAVCERDCAVTLALALRHQTNGGNSSM